MTDLYSIDREFMFCLPWKLSAPFYPTVIPDDALSKSDQPTRHVAIVSRSGFISKEELIQEIQLNTRGEIRAVYPNVVSSGTVMIISFFCLSDATRCLDFIDKKFKIEYKAYYAKPCSIQKNLNEKVFIIINEQHFDYMRYLTRIGDIHSISSTTIVQDCILLNLEFDDERANEKLFQCSLIQDAPMNVYMASNDQHLCHCHTSYFSSPPLSSASSSTLKRDSISSSQDSMTVYPTWKDAIVNGSAKKQQPPPPVVHEAPVDDTNLVDLERIERGLDTRTTFMIRNIPNKYTQKMLIDCINKTHANTFDFIYLRIDFKNKCNVGYAFINFIEPRFAVSFAKEHVGKSWKHFNSDKKCSLSYANIQGKDALVKKFKNSTVMFEQRNYRPKLYYSNGPNRGKEQDFPKPDIQSKSPQMKSWR